MWAVCGNVNENDSNYRYRFTQPAIAGMGPGSTWIKEEQAQAVANKQLVDPAALLANQVLERGEPPCFASPTA
jgi:hypothetical protein